MQDSHVREIKRESADLWATWTRRFKGPGTGPAPTNAPTNTATMTQQPRTNDPTPAQSAPPPPPPSLATQSKPAAPPPPPSLATVRAAAAAPTGSPVKPGAGAAGVKGAQGGGGGGESGVVGGKSADEIIKMMNPELAAELAEEEERLRQRMEALEASTQRRYVCVCLCV